MAVPQTHARDWLDTVEYIRTTFQDYQLLKELKTRNSTVPINHADLNVTTASKWAYLLTYGAYRIAGGRVPDQYHIQAVSIGELIAPVLPVGYFLPRDEANRAVRNILIYFAANETIVNRGRTKATYIASHNQVVNEEGDADEQNELINVNMSDEAFIREHGRGFAEFMLMPSPNESSLAPIDIFTTLYIAVAKRGNVTEDFLAEITIGLLDDLQYEARLSAEAIQMVYKFYRGFITANNAQRIMDVWLNDIPEVALRVQLTLQQATNSGLTALVTCGRATRKYPDFPWARLNNLTGDLENLRAAIALVDGNQYYGFNKSLGEARSTLYSSIAYVAKELLIALNGEVSLKRYAGWVRAPKNAAVKALIDNYKQAYTERMENGEVGLDDVALGNDLVTLLGNAGNANLFA